MSGFQWNVAIILPNSRFKFQTSWSFEIHRFNGRLSPCITPGTWLTGRLRKTTDYIRAGPSPHHFNDSTFRLEILHTLYVWVVLFWKQAKIVLQLTIIFHLGFFSSKSSFRSASKCILSKSPVVQFTRISSSFLKLISGPMSMVSFPVNGAANKRLRIIEKSRHREVK